MWLDKASIAHFIGVTVLTSPKKEKTAVHGSNPAVSVLAVSAGVSRSLLVPTLLYRFLLCQPVSREVYFLT